MPRKEKHFKKVGYTSGCLECRKTQRGEKSSDGHSQECRKRVIELLGETDEFKDDVARTNRKLQEALARELERTINMNRQVRESQLGPPAKTPQRRIGQHRKYTVAAIQQKVILVKAARLMLEIDLATRH